MIKDAFNIECSAVNIRTDLIINVWHFSHYLEFLILPSPPVPACLLKDSHWCLQWEPGSWNRNEAPRKYSAASPSQQTPAEGQHVQGRRGCLGRAVLWEPANKPSTAVLACQSLGWLPHVDQSSCGAPREGAGLCCRRSLWLPWLCGLPHDFFVASFFFFFCSSTRAVWLLASHGDVWLLQDHCKVKEQQEGTPGAPAPLQVTCGTCGTHTWEGTLLLGLWFS